MNTQIQSIKFNADHKLISFIEHKLAKIDRFNDSNIGSEVILRLDKDHENGNKVVVMKVIVPGDELVAERRSHTFEEAVDDCVEAIKKQIEKYKAK